MENVAQTILMQVGRMNVLAISGGRAKVSAEGGVVLPVRYGYGVHIVLDRGTDTYRVERTFTRSGRCSVKREWTMVHAEQLGDVAYTASCFRD